MSIKPARAVRRNLLTGERIADDAHTEVKVVRDWYPPSRKRGKGEPGYGIAPGYGERIGRGIADLAVTEIGETGEEEA